MVVSSVKCVASSPSWLPLPAFSSLLRKCIKSLDLAMGRSIHDHIIRHRLERFSVLMNFLVQLYGKCGALQDARLWFCRMPQRNVFSWTIFIAACIQHGHCESALQLFQQMQQEGVQPDKFTFSTILGACTSQEALAHGQDIHACIVDCGFDMEVVVMTALVNMYGSCGSPENARSVFDRMCLRDAMSWNSMIAIYAQNGHGKEALQLYHRMRQERVKPTEFTFTAVLCACSTIETLTWGKEIHASIINFGLELDVVKTALVNMYAKCGCLEDAQRVFDDIHSQDVVSWNVLIEAYIQHGCGKEAVEIYDRMLKMRFQPSIATLTSVLVACSILGALARGKGIHDTIVNTGLESDIGLGTALVNLYAKCGSIADAWIVFDRIHGRDVIAWNAMLAACAQNGHGRKTFRLFQCMQVEGVEPDEVTFLSVLCSCSHTGLLDHGWGYFHAMKQDHGIMPSTKHYACMIDLFGRAGQLEEAEYFMKEMPLEPDTVVLTAFLGACRVHGDAERGKQAAEHIIDLVPEFGAPYVLLSNFYAAEGRWKDVATIRQTMEWKMGKHAGGG